MHASSPFARIVTCLGDHATICNPVAATGPIRSCENPARRCVDDCDTAQMPSDLGFKTLNAVHGAVKKLSGGRIGWRAGGMPVLELTTTGRRSGEKRSTMLTIPWQDDRSIAVVASRAGEGVRFRR